MDIIEKDYSLEALRLDLERQSDTPLYRQIEQQISQRIVDGQLVPGDRLPSVPQLMREHGLNARTVSQAYQCLADRGMVNAMVGKGTFVAQLSRRVGLKELGIVCFGQMEPGIQEMNSYTDGAYHGIRTMAERLEWASRWIPHDVDPVEVCQQRDLAGCVVFAGWAKSVAICERLQAAGRHVVCISGPLEPFPTICGDDQQGINLAMDHLFALGHQRIALLTSDLTCFSETRRLHAYLQAMAGRDVPIHPSWIASVGFKTLERDGVQSAFQQFFEHHHKPTAIVATGIYHAMAMQQALHRQRIVVPDQVSIVGYDDMPLAQWAMLTPLTTIRQPTFRMGELAVQSLIGLIEHRPTGNQILPVELVVRQSTARAPR